MSAYLEDFVSEMKKFESENFFASNEKCYKILLGAVICDAPARAFVKCVKTHNSYHCCERCVQRGEWCGKVILPDLAEPNRSDQSFVNQTDAIHHLDVSPLTHLNFGMVSGFPLDYMHLICLGVVRRLISLWMQGPSGKLSQNIVSSISDQLAIVRPYISKEFSRKPRSMSEFKQWKATELRQFLVYTGPVVLKSFLSKELYTNFLCLSVATRILLSSTLVKNYLNYCESLIKYFVQNFMEIYGKDQVVYNVHSLIHIVDDARR